MSLYGYQENWTKRAIAEMVQERLLECLEAPAEEDYTKHYTPAINNSFRPSPLSIVMLEKLVTVPIYLSLIGNNLPFHNQKLVIL
jgi:hypothetical protein